MDYMLDEPEYDDEPEEQDDQDFDDPDYDEDECASNASSDWQGDRF